MALWVSASASNRALAAERQALPSFTVFADEYWAAHARMRAVEKLLVNGSDQAVIQELDNLNAEFDRLFTLYQWFRPDFDPDHDDGKRKVHEVQRYRLHCQRLRQGIE